MGSPTRFYRLAWAFYLVLAVGGLVGMAALGKPIGLRLLVDPASWWLDLGLGLGSGLLLLALWLVVRRFAPSARRLEETLARLLGRLGGDEVVALALISAVGEELAFRGALQAAIGLVPAALLFALLHFGPGRPFRLWSAYALVGGLAFGLLVAERQALGAAIVGHLIVNLIQLRRLVEVRAADSAGYVPER